MLVLAQSEQLLVVVRREPLLQPGSSSSPVGRNEAARASEVCPLLGEQFPPRPC